MENESRFESKPTDPPKLTRPERGKFPNAPRNHEIICFKCQGRGHMSRECPNQQVVIITPVGGYESQDEQEDEPDDP